MSEPSRFLAGCLTLCFALVATIKLFDSCRTPSATCDSMIGQLAPTESSLDQFELVGKTRETITRSCVSDTWSQDAIDCFARGSGSLASIVTGCELDIGSDNAARLRAKFAEIDRAHLAR
jgi:hypothetical protein